MSEFKILLSHSVDQIVEINWMHERVEAMKHFIQNDTKWVHVAKVGIVPTQLNLRAAVGRGARLLGLNGDIPLVLFHKS